MQTCKIMNTTNHNNNSIKKRQHHQTTIIPHVKQTQKSSSKINRQFIWRTSQSSQAASSQHATGSKRSSKDSLFSENGNSTSSSISRPIQDFPYSTSGLGSRILHSSTLKKVHGGLQNSLRSKTGLSGGTKRADHNNNKGVKRRELHLINRHSSKTLPPALMARRKKMREKSNLDEIQNSGLDRLRNITNVSDCKSSITSITEDIRTENFSDTSEYAKLQTARTLESVLSLPRIPEWDNTFSQNGKKNNSKSVFDTLSFGASYKIHDGTYNDPVSIAGSASEPPTESEHSVFRSLRLNSHATSRGNSSQRAMSMAALVNIPNSIDQSLVPKGLRDRNSVFSSGGTSSFGGKYYSDNNSNLDLVANESLTDQQAMKKKPVPTREEYIKLIGAMSKHTYTLDTSNHNQNLRRAKSMEDLAKLKEKLQNDDMNLSMKVNRQKRFNKFIKSQEKDFDRLMIEPRKPLSELEYKKGLALTTKNSTKEVVLNVTYKDLCSLQPRTWLNDEVCNKYFKMIQERSEKNPGKYPKVWVCNTFFWFTLNGKDTEKYNYNAVRRWSTKAKVKVFELDLIIVPLHVGKMHWTLGVCDLREKAFYYYDSLPGCAPPNFEKTWRQYLCDEHKNKLGCDMMDPEEWTLQPRKFEPPQQNNGYDCGVFMCQFADCVARDIPFDFEQVMIDDIRLKMAVEISEETLSH